MSYVLVIAAIGAGLGVYLAWLASRLRRLHARVNAAADALSLRLIRRAAVAWELAQTLSELRGGTGAALKQAAMVALDAPSAEREATQSDLTRAIQEAIRRCELPAPRLGEVFAPVLAENRRVEMARSLYNDTVRDTAALRRQRFPRALRLASYLPTPVYFDINTALTLTSRTPAGTR